MMGLIECEPVEFTQETEYVTIPRNEYDDLIRKEARLSLLSAAVSADVPPSTLRRIARQENSAYRTGSIIGNFFTALGQGFADAQRPDRSVAEAADAAAQLRRDKEED